MAYPLAMTFHRQAGPLGRSNHYTEGGHLVASEVPGMVVIGGLPLPSYVSDPMFTSSQARVRAAVYEHFIRHGVAPDVSTLAGTLGIDQPEVLASLRESEDAHALALGQTHESIWMAHPFSAVPTPYPVETADGAQYGANCVRDALGVLALLGRDEKSATACRFATGIVRCGERNPRLGLNTTP